MSFPSPAPPGNSCQGTHHTTYLGSPLPQIQGSMYSDLVMPNPPKGSPLSLSPREETDSLSSAVTRKGDVPFIKGIVMQGQLGKPLIQWAFEHHMDPESRKELRLAIPLPGADQVVRGAGSRQGSRLGGELCPQEGPQTQASGEAGS